MNLTIDGDEIGVIYYDLSDEERAECDALLEAIVLIDARRDDLSDSGLIQEGQFVQEEQRENDVLVALVFKYFMLPGTPTDHDALKLRAGYLLIFYSNK